jgi:hypothetical protein
MTRISEMWQGIFARASAIRRQGLPPAPWSIPGLVLMSGLLALAGALLCHCQGNHWVFGATLVLIGQLIGGACGVPYRRMSQGALCGAMLGLLFFAYAAIT